MSYLKKLFGDQGRFATASIAVGLVLVGVLMWCFVPDSMGFLIEIFTAACITFALAMGLELFMGNSGILNWTYIGFVGIGAYVSGLLSMAPADKATMMSALYPFLQQLHLPIVPALIAGGLVAALLAAFIGWPLMRLSDAVGVITLFATLIVVHVIMTQWSGVTNGPRTFYGLTQYTTIWVALAMAVFSLIVAHVFRESALGLRLRATRDDRHAAAAIGISVVKTRYAAFVLSAFMGGLAGGVWAHYITSFAPAQLYTAELFVFLTMLVVGGSGGISGAATGIIVLTILRESLKQLEAYLGNLPNFPFKVSGLTEFVLAIVLIAMLIWRPGGLIGGHEWRMPWSRKRVLDPEETSVPVPEAEPAVKEA